MRNLTLFLKRNRYDEFIKVQFVEDLIQSLREFEDEGFHPVVIYTPLSDANEDECFDLGGVIDEIDAFLDMDISTDIENGYHDSEGDIIYLESLLIDDTSLFYPSRVQSARFVFAQWLCGEVEAWCGGGGMRGHYVGGRVGRGGLFACQTVVGYVRPSD
ncbi:hypothetical protein Tco_1409656 [Tanacetum coccineum]